MNRSCQSRRTASPRRPYRPTLEALEDRCVPASGYGVINLASDVPGLAQVTDPNLVNPWGVSFSPTGPFWFADNASGVSDLLDGHGQPFPLVVTVPTALADNSPTGTVFNNTAGFVVSENGVAAPARFLFATEVGTISGWTSLVDAAHAVLAVDVSASGARYKGLAIATDTAGQTFLYAADFSRGTVDVFDDTFHRVTIPDAFQDPSVPAGFAPFNIAKVGNELFVTYAQQDAAHYDNVAGAGLGFIDAFNKDGQLVQRFAGGGALDSPWGLALAPADFGPFGGSLLVGNDGDGHILAFDPWSGAFRGELTDDRGAPLALPGLWNLTFGNGHAGGDAGTLFFTAGIEQQQHGLFGAIQAPERRGADTGGAGTFDPNAPGETGDYPLPPSAGPTLQAKSPAEQPTLSVELTPLTGASLLLIPTLSPAALTSARIDTAAVAAPLPANAWSHDIALSVAAANATGLVSAPAHPANRFTPARSDDGRVTSVRNPVHRGGEALLAAVSDKSVAAWPAETSMAKGAADATVALLLHDESAPETQAEGFGFANRAISPLTLWTRLLVVVAVPTMWICAQSRDPLRRRALIPFTSFKGRRVTDRPGHAIPE